VGTETAEILSQQNYAGSTLQSTRIIISFCCLSFQTPCAYHFRQIKFHSVEETVILVVLQHWQKLWRHLGTNDGEKKLLLTRFYLDKLKTLTLTWKCTRYIMQISYLYASDFPAQRAETITNDPKLTLVMIKHCSDCSEISTNEPAKPEWRVALPLFVSRKKTKRLCVHVQLARGDLTTRNMKSCFQHENSHLFTLPKNKKCTKRSC